MIRAATMDDWSAIEHLLIDANLPLGGAREHLGGFVVAEEDGAIVGCAALERHANNALLRSVVIDPAVRGTRLGERLVRHLIDTARRDGIESLLLLTTTAAAWFPRFGFQPIERDGVPNDVLQSAEFRGACPTTAALMSLRL